ncbi:uncharacterized protein BO97DRAFT_306113, partial [Aspergillus homomorphus CBS 101889]
LRPISHAFDPAGCTPPAQPSTTFPIIQPETIARSQAFQHANIIHPPSHRVPWPTSLPIALQSKHWPQAEAAATSYLQTIHTHRPSRLTQDISRTHTLIDTAISYVINLLPLSNIARNQLLAKTYILLFLHDDAVDTRDPALRIPPRSTISKNHGSTTGFLAYDILAEEILAEDPTEGKRLLEEITSWGSATQCDRPQTFGSLEAYIVHGLKDFGAELILRTVRFSCEARFDEPEGDAQRLKSLEALCARHLLLTNDLYSYAKEVRAEGNGGERVLNAVRVVRGLMGGDDVLAKRMLRMVINDVEEKLSEECLRLELSGALSHAQRVYARAMVVAVAGNMFFSATSPRYAAAVEGSKL